MQSSDLAPDTLYLCHDGKLRHFERPPLTRRRWTAVWRSFGPTGAGPLQRGPLDRFARWCGAPVKTIVLGQVPT